MQQFMLTKKAKYVLHQLAAQSHPDQTFVAWVNNQAKDISQELDELVKARLVFLYDGEYLPTREGLELLKENNSKQLLQKIDMLVPKVPSFENLASNLTPTALMRAIYALLGEIGKRGDPDDTEAYKYWTEKVRDLDQLIHDNDPAGLWERYNKMKM